MKIKKKISVQVKADFMHALVELTLDIVVKLQKDFDS